MPCLPRPDNISFGGGGGCGCGCGFGVGGGGWWGWLVGVVGVERKALCARMGTHVLPRKHLAPPPVVLHPHRTVILDPEVGPSVVHNEAAHRDSQIEAHAVVIVLARFGEAADPLVRRSTHLHR